MLVARILVDLINKVGEPNAPFLVHGIGALEDMPAAICTTAAEVRVSHQAKHGIGLHVPVGVRRLPISGRLGGTQFNTRCPAGIKIVCVLVLYIVAKQADRHITDIERQLGKSLRHLIVIAINAGLRVIFIEADETVAEEIIIVTEECALTRGF